MCIIILKYNLYKEYFMIYWGMQIVFYNISSFQFIVVCYVFIQSFFVINLKLFKDNYRIEWKLNIVKLGQFE